MMQDIKKQTEIEIFINRFNDLFEKSYRVTNGRKKKLATRLETFSIGQILIATQNLSMSPWHRGVNGRGWQANPDFLIRNDEQVDKWLNYVPSEARHMAAVVKKARYGNKQTIDARNL